MKRIEIGPKSLERMNYDAAVLYCFFLEHDSKRSWRLPTVEEYESGTPTIFSYCWYKDDPYASDPSKEQDWYVVPVRDLDDL